MRELLKLLKVGDYVMLHRASSVDGEKAQVSQIADDGDLCVKGCWYSVDTGHACGVIDKSYPRIRPIRQYTTHDDPGESLRITRADELSKINFHALNAEQVAAYYAVFVGLRQQQEGLTKTDGD